MSTSTIESFSVGVNGWSRQRRIEVRGDKVAMEIARINCSHCATCSRRMDAVTGRVHRAGLQVEWERVGGGQFIVVPLPEGVDPVKHLSNLLGLGIYR